MVNVSIATDKVYLDSNTGSRVEKTEWHRVGTFRPDLIDMLEKHARKGRLVYVSGTLQKRRWRKDGEDSDRFSTELLLAPGGPVPILERPNGTSGSNGAEASQAEARVSDQSATEATADAGVITSDILRTPWGPAPAFSPRELAPLCARGTRSSHTDTPRASSGPVRFRRGRFAGCERETDPAAAPIRPRTTPTMTNPDTTDSPNLVYDAIGDRSGQSAVAEHPAHVQRLGDDGVVLVHRPPSEAAFEVKRRITGVLVPVRRARAECAITDPRITDSRALNESGGS